MYRRRRRRLNKTRFTMFILLLTLIAAAVIYLFKGGLPWNRDGSTDNISPTPSVRSINREQFRTPPQPRTNALAYPEPARGTDTAILKVSWQTPAVSTDPTPFPNRPL